MLPLSSINNSNVPEAEAYPSNNQWYRRLSYVIIGCFGLLLLKNILFIDYKEQTKSYLTSIGRSDVIDQVIPKTYSDIQNEKIEQYITMQDLIYNLSITINDVKYLRHQLNLNTNITTINNNDTTIASNITTLSNEIHLLKHEIENIRKNNRKHDQSSDHETEKI